MAPAMSSPQTFYNCNQDPRRHLDNFLHTAPHLTSQNWVLGYINSTSYGAKVHMH